jgi:phosphoesterase RecJ-like protein
MKDIITSKKFALIFSHQGPDGDSLGSSLALSEYLNVLKIPNKVIVPDQFSINFKWLNGIEQVVIANEDIEVVQKHIDSSDLIFCLDFNHRSRVGSLLSPLLNDIDENKTVIVIDHHTYPENFGDYQIIDEKASSTCELVYSFIKDNGHINKINKNIGEAIYLGLVTDTGSFKFSSVTPLTHQIASHLIDIGIDHSKIQNNVYDQNNISKINLLGYALQKIKLDENSSLAYLSLSQDELNRFDHKKGDTEGFVNFCLSIKDVEVAAFLREDKDMIKISFRSKGNIKVNEFSKKYYSGGGHKNAAGGALFDRKIDDDVINELIKNFRLFCLVE